MVLQITDDLPGKQTKSEAYADDFSAGGTILYLKSWWLNLCRLGPLFGYFSEETKC